MSTARWIAGFLLLSSCQSKVDPTTADGGAAGAAASGAHGPTAGESSGGGGTSTSSQSSTAGEDSTAGADGGADTNGGGAPTAACTGGPEALEELWPLPNVTPSALAVDPQGNVYLSGTFRGSVQFGAQTLTSAGEGDIFLAKYDASGALSFAVRYGNAANDDPGTALAVDGAGNVFLGGFFSGTVDFGGGTKPLVAVTVDAFTVKVSTSGQTLWAQHFGYDSGPYDVGSIAVGPDGNPVIGGTSLGPITLGDQTLPEARGSAEQPFVAKLNSADGSVAWSAASGGNFDTDKIHVAVDAAGRSFVVGRVLSGSGAWGAGPSAVGTFRVGLSPSGTAVWSQFDLNTAPVSLSVDASGRLAVVENAAPSPQVGAKVFQTQLYTTLALLLSPIDGTLLSGNLFSTSTFPWAGAVDGKGNAFAIGQYGSNSFNFGSSVLSSPGPVPTNEALFVAALDGASRAEGAQRVGGSGNTQPYAAAVTPAGKVLVAASNDTAFSGPNGTVQPGTFIALFGADACANHAGPLGPSTGSTSNHGALSTGTVTPPDAGSAECPASTASAVNGAACPTAMGCSYDTTCCFCTPTACGNADTTWTCNSLANPDPSCPSLPPAPASTCPAGVQCNYCLPDGRFFANCTPGGWSTGYAQLLCN